MSPMINGEFVEPTNADRALWAAEALIKYARLTRHNSDEVAALHAGDQDAAQEILGDLLSDLRHYADTNSLDFDEINDGARRNYQEECEDE